MCDRYSIYVLYLFEEFVVIISFLFCNIYAYGLSHYFTIYMNICILLPTCVEPVHSPLRLFHHSLTIHCSI
jgi:hypothetical protein